MNVFDDCKGQILDWIADQIVANAGCTTEIAAYDDLALQIRAINPLLCTCCTPPSFHYMHTPLSNTDGRPN